ncbi:hypothetical protein [Phyllobacterium phragmitis]|nr:hypothetical protein [Phyllobacterium phragmitis]
MNKKFIFTIAALSMTALAGCSESEQASNQTPATTKSEQPTAAAPATTTPTTSSVEAEATKTAEELVNSMSPQEKTQAVNEARTAAEAAAKAAGQSDDLVTQAGNAAEAEAKKALGAQ